MLLIIHHTYWCQIILLTRPTRGWVGYQIRDGIWTTYGGLLHVKILWLRYKFLVWSNYEEDTWWSKWDYATTTHGWFTNRPCLHKLWQLVLIIPSSTTMCERCFSKQNLSKSHLWASMALDMLDADFIANNPIHEIDWDNVILSTNLIDEFLLLM